MPRGLEDNDRGPKRNLWWHEPGVSGHLHMIPVDRAGSVTEMKLVSVHLATVSPLSEMNNVKK